MIRTTITTLALLAIALIGTAGPAAAFDGWCLLEPIHCATAEVAARADRSSERGATDDTRVDEMRRTDTGTPTDPTDASVEVGGLVADAGVLIQVSDGTRDAIDDGMVVDITTDPIPLPPTDSSSGATSSESADPVGSGPSVESPPSTPTETPTATHAETDVPTEPEPTESEGADDGSGHAMIPAPAEGSSINPIVAGSIGALGALLVAALLGAAFIVGRRSSR